MIDFIGANHRRVTRDYLRRVMEHDKAHCAEVAGRWGADYWDGERQYGYGGYRYDGRWRSVAEAMVQHYRLPANASILDVGCGKGFLLLEFQKLLPECQPLGIDVSPYAIEHAPPEIRGALRVGEAHELPFADHSFDLVISINTLHNLYIQQLWQALTEIQRVGRDAKYVCVESYRNEREKVNLLYWQLTCRAFHATHEWEWIFQQTGYSGDFSFIFFE